jgi:hypothetical protein
MYSVVTPLLGTLFMACTKIVNFLSDGDKKEWLYGLEKTLLFWLLWVQVVSAVQNLVH